MDPSHTLLYHPDYLDVGSQPRKRHAHAPLWFTLAGIELLLLIRLALTYLDVSILATINSTIYAITELLIYPFAALLSIVRGSTQHSEVSILLFTIIGYFLLAISLIAMVQLQRSPRARLERARTLSRRRYSH